jgi:hypothetical protein
MRTARLHSAGDCPVCADLGALLCVESIANGTVILLCPLCGTAWDEPPIEGLVDAVRSLQEVAPSGIALPSDDALKRFAARSLVEVDTDEWYDLLARYLAKS